MATVMKEIMETVGATLVVVGSMFAIAGVIGAGCKSTSQTTPQSIYSELVDGNCLQKDDSGLPSVQAAFTSDAAPPWFLCLKDGGTIGACGVPCDATTVTVIPNR
jgi:hypothetical protein